MLRRTVLVARMGSPFSATLASSLSQTGVRSGVENSRLERENLAERRRKIPHVTPVAPETRRCRWARCGVRYHVPVCRDVALRGCSVPRRGAAPERGTPAPPAHEVRAFSSLRSRTARLRPGPARHAPSCTADGAVRGRRSPPGGGDRARCEARPQRTQAQQPTGGIPHIGPRPFFKARPAETQKRHALACRSVVWGCRAG